MMGQVCNNWPLYFCSIKTWDKKFFRVLPTNIGRNLMLAYFNIRFLHSGNKHRYSYRHRISTALVFLAPTLWIKIILEYILHLFQVFHYTSRVNFLCIGFHWENVEPKGVLAEKLWDPPWIVESNLVSVVIVPNQL